MLVFIVSLCMLTGKFDSRAVDLYCMQKVPWLELVPFVNKLAESKGVDGHTAKTALGLDFLQPRKNTLDRSQRTIS